MKRTVCRIVVVALVSLAMLIPQVVAFARGEDSDNGCPPRAKQGADHASATGIEATTAVNPPANDNAWAASVGSNPGNK